MTVGREQVLSDERYVANRREIAGGRDLLAELEQAERERDDWRAGFAAERDRGDAAETSLSRVPALVEALQQICSHRAGHLQRDVLREIARDALAAWEQQ